MTTGRPTVYLDYNATTPVDPRVVEAMMPWFTERFGNPHSVDHRFGEDAAEAVAEARRQVARLVGADPREIIFTSGATESNNLAIKGAARFERRHRGRRNRVVTLASEHKCVLESVRALGQEGFETDILPVAADGRIDTDRLEEALGGDVILVSVMAANNEIGTLQPLAEIAAMTRACGALFHTDAAQAAGRVPLDVTGCAIDLMSLSGHKFYGPKGIGALYVRRRPRARIEPLFSGGGQERTLRSGTVAAPLAVGIGAAAALADAEREREAARLTALANSLHEALATKVSGVSLNGPAAGRLPGNLNLRVEGIDAHRLIALAPEVAFSTGSACTSAEVLPSHVLDAAGLTDDEARASFRLCVGRFTTADDVAFAADRLAEAIGLCRAGAQ